MMQTKLDRLRARGTVVIEADSDGYSVSWWPKGQKGNPFCGRGGKGPVLEPLVVALEAETRPMSRDWEGARAAREWEAERRAEERLRIGDREDRWREKRDRQRVADAAAGVRRAQDRERHRVRRVLTS